VEDYADLHPWHDLTEVADDYAAAARLGMEPPRIRPEHMTTAAGMALMVAWLRERDLYGVRHRWLAEHGEAVWCPDWCHDDHGPVQVLQPDAGGDNHSYRPHTVGWLRGVYQMWESSDQTEREEVVIVKHDDAGREGYDGWLQVPLTAVPDLIELLQTLPLPPRP